MPVLPCEVPLSLLDGIGTLCESSPTRHYVQIQRRLPESQIIIDFEPLQIENASMGREIGEASACIPV